MDLQLTYAENIIETSKSEVRGFCTLGSEESLTEGGLSPSMYKDV